MHICYSRSFVLWLRFPVYECITNHANVMIQTFVIDIDECASKSHDCNMFATCSNTMGSYTCTCNSGYQGDGRQCIGIFVYFFFLFF